MEGVPDEERTATVCLCHCGSVPGRRGKDDLGTIEGRVGYEIKGEHGFGYDPIFYLPEYGCTTAELPPEKKNEISHRGRGLQKMKKLIEGR